MLPPGCSPAIKQKSNPYKSHGQARSEKRRKCQLCLCIKVENCRVMLFTHRLLNHGGLLPNITSCTLDTPSSILIQTSPSPHQSLTLPWVTVTTVTGSTALGFKITRFARFPLLFSAFLTTNPNVETHTFCFPALPPRRLYKYYESW